MRELSLHILDLVQNSLEAGATEVSIEIEEDSQADRLTIKVTDNGRGMTAEEVKRVTDPFFTSRGTRRVGLGLPLIAAAAEQCGGELEVRSAPGVGTQVTATMQLGHIDRVPLGNVAGTLLTVMLHQPPVILRFRHRADDSLFEFDTAEMIAELGEVPFSHPAVLRWLREFLADGYANLYGGSVNAESANHRGASSSPGRGST